MGLRDKPPLETATTLVPPRQQGLLGKSLKPEGLTGPIKALVFLSVQ